MFFDMGPNLLNVAVSRAKDSFLVFGDMRIFDPSKDTLPSGKLARLAFQSENGEITDIESAQHLRTGEEMSRISTLEEHRKALRQALEESKERVLIVSPYLTKGAVTADDIPTLLKAAKERGVRVCVVYSRDLNHWPDSAARVAEMLSKAGAEIKVATRMHSKTLAVDGSRLIEGSFNWLSAKREEGHPHQYQESSLDYQGAQASKLIVNAWRDATGEEIPLGKAV
jgi:phosphatidylserine/phosphatidylglycerophosphate/cardiolipin synthase-like enzyme